MMSKLIYCSIFICFLFERTLTSSCPPGCKCSSDFKTVTCDNLGLTQPPDNIPTEVVNLFLRHNSMTTLDASAFSNLPHLKYLYLSANRFASIPPLSSASVSSLALDNNIISDATFPDVYSNCPLLTTVQLSTNSIGSLTGATFKALVAVQSLDLSSQRVVMSVDNSTLAPIAKTLLSLTLTGNSQLTETRVAQLLTGLKGTGSLVQLNVRKTGISQIDSTLFSGLQLTQLNNLDISDNIFTTVTGSSFSTLPSSLKILQIRNSKLTVLASNTFAVFEKLIILLLDGGNIVNVSANAFSGLNLRSLSLAGNKIERLESGAFGGMTGIGLLDLSWQQANSKLTEIGDGALCCANTVTLLLTGNSVGNVLTNAHSSPFDNLVELQNLYVGNNNILGFYAASLAGLKSLRHLFAPSNQITFWEAGAFAEFSATLITLDLSNNSLSRVGGSGPGNNSLAGLTALAYLNVTGNPFDCTCDGVADFLRWQRTTKVEVVKMNELMCASPPDWKGKYVISFNPESCPTTANSATAKTHANAYLDLKGKSAITFSTDSSKLIPLNRTQHGWFRYVRLEMLTCLVLVFSCTLAVLVMVGFLICCFFRLNRVQQYRASHCYCRNPAATGDHWGDLPSYEQVLSQEKAPLMRQI